MVLVIDGDVPNSIESLPAFYEKYPNLLENATKLASIKPKTIRPEGVLYARQKVGVVNDPHGQTIIRSLVKICLLFFYIFDSG